MIAEGLKLMVTGMATVFLFLGLQIFLINFIAYLTRGQVGKELEQLKKEKEARAQKGKKGKGGSTLPIAVITAAITQFEQDQQK